MKRRVKPTKQLVDLMVAEPVHRGKVCAVCSLPRSVIDAVNQCMRSGISSMPILRVLRKEGYNVSYNNIHYHYKSGHHLKKARPA